MVTVDDVSIDREPRFLESDPVPGGAHGG